LRANSTTKSKYSGWFEVHNFLAHQQFFKATRPELWGAEFVDPELLFIMKPILS